MMGAPQPAWDIEVLPRYVFLEPLIAQSRVLEIDAVSLTGGRSARFLRERGASHVVAIDTDEEAIRRAWGSDEVTAEGIAFRAGDYTDIEGSAFDLVVMHRCARLMAEPRRLEALKARLTRLGRLVLVLRHGEGLAFSDLFGRAGGREPDYGELLRLLQASFSSVEVALQTAYLGYAVIPAGVPEPVTTLDESLADTPTPAYYLFVCGARPAKLDTAALTMLPSAVMDALASSGREPPAPPPPPPPAPRPLVIPPPLPPPPDSSVVPELSLFEDLDSELQAQRVRELEARTQAALDEAQRAEFTAAQALAERDQLRRRVKALQGVQAPGAYSEAPAARAEAEAREQKLRGLTEQVDILTGVAEAMRRELTRREAEMEQAHLELAAREEALARAVAAEQAALAECARLQEQAVALGRELEEQAAIAERLEASLTATKAELANTGGHFLEQEREGWEARERAAALELELLAERERAAVLALEARASQEEVARLLGELEKREAELAAGAGQVEVRARALDDMREQVTAVGRELADARGEIHRLGNLLQEQTARAEVLHMESREQQERLEQAIAAREAAEARARKVEEELAARAREAEQQIQALAAEIAALKAPQAPPAPTPVSEGGA